MSEDLKQDRTVVFIYFEEFDRTAIQELWNEEPKSANLHVVRAGPGLDLEFNGASNYWKGPITASELLDQIKPVVVRVHNPSEQHIEIAAAVQNRGIPILYDQMDLWSEFAAKPWGATGETWYLENASQISVVSGFLAKRLPGKPVCVVPNGVTQEFIESCRTNRLTMVRDPQYDVVYAGAMWPDWIDWPLIEDLVARTPALRWCFVGAVVPPPYENHGDEAIKAVGRLSRLPQVTFLGEINHSELAGVLVDGRVGLVPFKTNPLTLGASPIKVYDYLAAGLPVVCFDTPEVNGLDWVVRCRSVSDYLNAIKHYVADEVWRLTSVSNQIELHTWERRLKDLDVARNLDKQ